MKTALLATVIFIGVFAFVGVQAWLMYRRTGRAMDIAAEERARGIAAAPIRYTTLQKHLYVGSLVLSTSLFIAGIVASMGRSTSLGVALVLTSVGLVCLRLIAVRVVTRRAGRERL